MGGLPSEVAVFECMSKWSLVKGVGWSFCTLLARSVGLEATQSVRKALGGGS